MVVGVMLTIWQDQLYQKYLTSFRAGHLGHAQMLFGPAMLGKHAVVQHLAKRLLCLEATNNNNACASRPIFFT